MNSAADPVGAKATVDLAAGLVASALGAVILATRAWRELAQETAA